MDENDYCSLVEQHSQTRNLDQPVYHFQQDTIHTPCNYYCSLIGCGGAFSTESAYPTKKLAQNEAAKIACQELGLIESKTFTEDPEFSTDKNYDQFYDSGGFLETPIQSKIKEKSKQGNYSADNSQQNIKNKKLTNNGQRRNVLIKHCLKHLPTDFTFKTTKHGTTVNISSIAEVLRYMHGDVLAASFKSLIHAFSQDEKVRPAKLESQYYKCDEHRIFKTVCTFKGQKFESLGM